MSLLEQFKVYLTEFLNEQTKEMKYNYYMWQEKLILADKILFICVVLLLGFFRSDALMIGIYIMLYPYALLTSRKIAFRQLFVSSGIALLWVLFANKQYGYNQDMILVFGLNSFPLFAWASGLFGAYLIYSHIEHRLQLKRFYKKLLLFVTLYWPILIALETIAYHIFNIKNVSTAMYVGLPICDCLHAPLWMKISYFALGPIYFTVCQILGLENPDAKQRQEVRNSKLATLEKTLKQKPKKMKKKVIKK